MERTVKAIVAVCVATAFPAAASATTFVTEKFVCPVGGETFEAEVVMSSITFGQRPDGKPYGPLPVYPIPECPSNGLPLFDPEFSEDELEILAQAIATDEYQAMRATDTPHYRAWWLMNRLNRDPLEQLGALLQATWETDHDWDRKVRYMVAFVNRTARSERTEANAQGWFWFTLRAANALRELGHFDKATALLEVAMTDGNRPVDPQGAENVRFYAGTLATLIAEENPLSEPASLVPARVAAFRCTVPRPPLTDSEERACGQDEVREAIAQIETRDEEGQMLSGEAAIRYLESRRTAGD